MVRDPTIGTKMLILTRSRHLIDGSLFLDGFRSGWMAAIAALGSRRSHVTGFQALTTGVAEHESALEWDFVTLISFADAGAVVTAQPITIWFEHEGRRRRYTPDFRVDWTEGGIDIVEIKYRV